MRRAALLFALLMVGAPVFAELPPVDSFSVSSQRGFAVALDGDWTAVGAPQEEQNEIGNAGAVRLFHLEGGVWMEKHGLVSQTPKDAGRFGHSVALSGDTLAVGAPGERKVYVYKHNGNAWFLQLIAQGEEEGRPARLGESVALDGDWLAVGRIDPHGQGAPGSVHLLHRVADEWIKVLPPLLGDPNVPDERFGHSLSMRDGTLSAGAPGADESRGAVYVFEFDGQAWIRSARLTASDGAPGDQLGFSVAVDADGDEIVAGAPTADVPGAVNQGALYVFQEGERWEDGKTGRVAVPGIDAGDQLGHSVAIDDGLLAAGAPFDSADASGAIHLLGWEGLSWHLLDTVDGSEMLDLFGFSVAVRGSHAVVGAPLGPDQVQGDDQ